jgi:hypothetical protein
VGWALVGGADEVEHVGAFCVIELQGSGDAFEHLLRRPGRVAALQAGVVLDADPREHRHLFAAKPLHAAVAPVGG